MKKISNCNALVRRARRPLSLTMLFLTTLSGSAIGGIGDDSVRAGRSSAGFDLLGWIRANTPTTPPPPPSTGGGASDLGTMINPLGELRYYVNTLDVALNLSVSGEGACVQAELYKGVSHFHLTNDCENATINNSGILAPGSHWGIKPGVGMWRTSIVALGAGITWSQLGWDKPPYILTPIGSSFEFDCSSIGSAEAAEFKRLADSGIGVVPQMPKAVIYNPRGNSWSWYRVERWHNGAYETVENIKSAAAVCVPELGR